MPKDGPTRIASSDRSMDTANPDSTEVFFYPKHTPPTSVRAATREEADRILEASNKKDRD